MKKVLCIFLAGWMILGCPVYAKQEPKKPDAPEEEEEAIESDHLDAQEYPKGSRLNPYELGDEIPLGMTYNENRYMDITLIPEELLDADTSAGLYSNSWVTSDEETIRGKIRTGSASSDDEEVDLTFEIELFTDNMSSVKAEIKDFQTGRDLDSLYSYFEYEVLFTCSHFAVRPDDMNVALLKVTYYPDQESFDTQKPSAVWINLAAE